MDLQLRLGRRGDTIAVLSELVSTMPLRERLHELLVLALYRSGRQADALRAYREWGGCDIGTEIGIEPGADLRDLRRVLQQDPSLRLGTSRPAASCRRRAERGAPGAGDVESSPVRLGARRQG